jgi:hypothetical protein
MFVEDFPATEEEKISGFGSPVAKETKNFGVRLLHQIARCIYDREEVDGVIQLTVRRGELGGWIENYGNLSQDGKSWVHPNGIACMDSIVGGNAQIEDGEVGDRGVVYDDSVVKGNSVVRERGKVGGTAVVDKESVIEGNACFGNASCEGSRIGGRAFVIGKKKLSTDETIIVNSVMDGNTQASGGFRIEESEIHDSSYVAGCRLEKVKMFGDSFATGTVIGPMTVEDGMLDWINGNSSSDILKEEIGKRVEENNDTDCSHLLFYIANFRV